MTLSIFEWSEVSLWGSQTTKPIHTASTQDETVLQYFYKDLNLKEQWPSLKKKVINYAL